MHSYSFVSLEEVQQHHNYLILGLPRCCCCQCRGCTSDSSLCSRGNSCGTLHSRGDTSWTICPPGACSHSRGSGSAGLCCCSSSTHCLRWSSCDCGSLGWKLYQQPGSGSPLQTVKTLMMEWRREELIHAESSYSRLASSSRLNQLYQMYVVNYKVIFIHWNKYFGIHNIKGNKITEVTDHI